MLQFYTRPLQQQLFQRREERSDECHVVSRHRDKTLCSVSPNVFVPIADCITSTFWMSCRAMVESSEDFWIASRKLSNRIGRFDTDHICGRVR